MKVPHLHLVHIIYVRCDILYFYMGQIPTLTSAGWPALVSTDKYGELLPAGMMSSWSSFALQSNGECMQIHGKSDIEVFTKLREHLPRPNH